MKVNILPEEPLTMEDIETSWQVDGGLARESRCLQAPGRTLLLLADHDNHDGPWEEVGAHRPALHLVDGVVLVSSALPVVLSPIPLGRAGGRQRLRLHRVREQDPPRGQDLDSSIRVSLFSGCRCAGD
jgi:hypothetical protein